MSLDVSVLIATRNRCEHIARSLLTVVEAVRSSTLDSEVVIIDNGSTDRTPDLLADLTARYGLRVVIDPMVGKSGALNRALKLVDGEAVLFTDDDVHVRPSWVADMATPILEDRADGVAGKVELAAHLERSWLTQAMRRSLAELLDVSGTTPGMVGANMAARRTAAMRASFDEELGPGALGSGEDLLFKLRLQHLGYRLVGASGPPAVHHLDSSRLDRRSMRRFAAMNGRSSAYVWRHWLQSKPSLIPLRRIHAEAGALAQVLRPRTTDFSDPEYGAFYRQAFYRGLAKEYRRTARYRAGELVGESTGE